MEWDYRQIARHYPNGKIRVTKTRYPYETKFRGLEVTYCNYVLFIVGAKGLIWVVLDLNFSQFSSKTILHTIYK